MIPINVVAQNNIAGGQSADRRGDNTGAHKGEARQATLVQVEASGVMKSEQETKVVTAAKQTRETERDEEHLPNKNQSKQQERREHKLDILV